MSSCSPTKKLKIAVQCHGHLRTFRRCLPVLKNLLLQDCQADFFIHTWTSLDHSTKSWHDSVPMQGDVEHEVVEKELQAMLCSVRKLVVEKQIIKDYGQISINTVSNRPPFAASIFGFHSMFHSMREANRLREEYQQECGVEYDYVLCVRPDLLLKKKISLTSILAAFPQESLNRALFTLAWPARPAVHSFYDLSGTDVLFFAQPVLISHVFGALNGLSGKLVSESEVDYSPEYLFIELVEKLGYVPYRIALYPEHDYHILRTPQKLNIRKRFIRLRITHKQLRLLLMPLLHHQVFRLKVSILDFYSIEFCIGNIKKEY